MKKVIASLAIIFSIFPSQIYATSKSELSKKIEQSLNFKDGSLKLKKNQTDFVKISFKVTKSGGLQILELNYSDEGIKGILVSKLKQIKGLNNVGEIYNFCFSFKKL